MAVRGAGRVVEAIGHTSCCIHACRGGRERRQGETSWRRHAAEAVGGAVGREMSWRRRHGRRAGEGEIGGEGDTMDSGGAKFYNLGIPVF
jgi:hypothetical protein